MTYVSRQPIQSPHRPNTGLEIGRNGLIRADSGFDGRIGRVPSLEKIGVYWSRLEFFGVDWSSLERIGIEELT